MTMLQLACAWNLAQTPVRCVAPTLIQEPGPRARPIEDKRAELAAVPELIARSPLHRRGGASDPGDRREHRLHGAEGRQPRARGTGARRTAGGWTASWQASPGAGASTPRATSSHAA